MESKLAMEPDRLRTYLLEFPDVTEEMPFGPETAVYKTTGKVFALTDWQSVPLRINLKCEPERAEQLRDAHRCVEPGYHMNKKHWNTVTVDGSVPDAVLLEWIQHSFRCVLKGMPKARQQALLAQWEAGTTPSAAYHEGKALRDHLLREI